jgi:hypothetical protein
MSLDIEEAFRANDRPTGNYRLINICRGLKLLKNTGRLLFPT